MKKIYLLLSLLIITAGCEEEELFSPAAETDTTEEILQEINFKDLPAKISNNFNDEQYFVHKSGKAQGLFGPVNIGSKVQKINYYKTLSSYTFALVTDIKVKSSGNYYFDNLVLKEQADGSIDKITYDTNLPKNGRMDREISRIIPGKSFILIQKEKNTMKL